MNLTKDSKIILLSHNDLDGYGPEIVLRSWGFQPTVVNVDNQKVDNTISKTFNDLLSENVEIPDVIFITDISPSKEMGKMVEQFVQTRKCPVFLFDHHPTALELNQYPWATVIVEENGAKPCGTSLFYQFLQGHVDIPLEEDVKTSLDRFVEEVRLYDVWDWEKINHVSAKNLNDLFYLVGAKVFVDSQVKKIQEGNTALFSDEEEKLLDIEHRRIEKYLQNKKQDMVIISDFFTDENGNPLVAGVVQADLYISELGHYLCDEHPEIDFALLLNFTHNKASLRAVKEEINLIPIVKRYSGGGHPHAAGCNITPMGMTFIQKVWEKVLER